MNSIIVSAAENSIKARGYIKTLATLTDFTDINVEFIGNNSDDVPEYEVASMNTLRLELFWQFDETITSEFAYELIPRIQETDGLESFFAVQAADPLSYRAIDLGEKVYSSNKNSDFQLFHNLDRAFITVSPPLGDFYIGRQPVAFGSARVINPTDILTSYTYTELNKEERIGVDAVRMKFPAGTMGEIDIGAVFGDDFTVKESAAFLRAKFFLFETDLSPMAILFKQNILLGVDIARSLGDAGYWLEGAYTFANIADNHIPQQDYVRISTGLDYSFTENLYAYIEYHYNGAGKSKAEDYRDLILNLDREIAYQEGAVYLFGKHYLAPGFAYQITPLITVNAGMLYNFRDSSALLFPVFQYSLSDEATVEAGTFVGIGKKSEIIRNAETGAVDISTRSEFGLYTDTYFISATWYF